MLTTSAHHFPTSTLGLPEAHPPELVELGDGDELDLRIALVAKRLAGTTTRMLAYNGSVPGPTLLVRQGSQLVVNVANDGDLETTVHWHGLRLDNRYDGTAATQRPLPVGGRFTFRLDFPDPGTYWNHPHIREDYAHDGRARGRDGHGEIQMGEAHGDHSGGHAHGHGADGIEWQDDMVGAQPPEHRDERALEDRRPRHRRRRARDRLAIRGRRPREDPSLRWCGQPHLGHIPSEGILST